VEATFSAPVQTGRGAHPASCTMGTVSFPGVKSGRGVCLYKGALYLFPYRPSSCHRGWEEHLQDGRLYSCETSMDLVEWKWDKVVLLSFEWIYLLFFLRKYFAFFFGQATRKHAARWT